MNPKSAGPTIIPAWKATDFKATTRSTTSSGAQSMGNARLAGIAKALPTPKSAMKAKIGKTPSGSEAT